MGMLGLSLGYLSEFHQPECFYNHLQADLELDQAAFIEEKILSLASGLNPHDMSDLRLTTSESLIIPIYTFPISTANLQVIYRVRTKLYSMYSMYTVYDNNPF